MGIEKQSEWKDVPPQPELQIVPEQKKRGPDITPGMIQEIIEKLPEEEEDKKIPPTIH